MTIIMPSSQVPFRIGTRGSPLALVQAHETRDRLRDAFDLPIDAFEIVVIKTTGDNQALIDADIALKTIGNKGLFTKEIEEALLGGKIDIAVHSMKDMPVAQPDGLLLDTYLPREDVRDAFVSIGALKLEEIAKGATIGSSSLRRCAQILARRPDLKVAEFRGNVQTRLRKLQDGVADGTFLAMAGLRRLNMINVPHVPIEVDDMLPAVAQGAIGIERKADDMRAAYLLAAIHDLQTGLRLVAERAFLADLDGSCHTPIAALAEIYGDQIRLRGEILREDGSEALSDDVTGSIASGPAMGRAMAQRLLIRAGPGFFSHR